MGQATQASVCWPVKEALSVSAHLQMQKQRQRAASGALFV